MEDKKQKATKDNKHYLKALMAEIEKSKKSKNIEEMRVTIAKIYEQAKTSDISTIQKFIILFYKYYNKTTYKIKRDDKFIQLSNFMIKNIANEMILLSIINEINKIFPESKIDSFQKCDDYEICFALCKLSHNIKIMEIFFSEYLNVNLFQENEYSILDLENPNTRNLFEDIFQNIYDKTKKCKKEDIDINEIIAKSNNSKNKLFRCQNCYDIMFMKLNQENNIEFECMQCKEGSKELKDIEALKTYYTKFYCSNCKDELFLYKENYKCISCKKLLCKDCKIAHLKSCFSFNYIKMHEVGFKCEIHNKNYTEYCFSCHKNLCENCKIIHHHKTKKLESIDDEVSTKKYDKINLTFKKNELIKYNLTQIYIELKERKLFNGFLYEISCALFQIKKEDYNKDIFFNQFNNNDFQNYYSKAIRKISNGNLYYLKHIRVIKDYYKNKKSKELEVNYDIINIRETEINKFIENTKSCLKELRINHRFINYDHNINDLKKINSDLLIKIEKINYELLQYRNSHRKIMENTHNILCRFLADELLNNFIYNYHNYMDKVAINLRIFLDLISSGNYDILSNEAVINSIAGISSELNEMLNQLKKKKEDENLKKNIIDFISSSKLSKIHFVEDIKLEGKEFKKEDLNSILELLFLIKNVGNKTAHPNIDPEESLKIIDMKGLPLEFNCETFCDEIIEKNYKSEISNLILSGHKEILSKQKHIAFEDDILKNIIEDEDSDLYYHPGEYEFSGIKLNKEYDIFNNIKEYKKLTNNQIEVKIKDYINAQLPRFNEGIIKENSEIKEIIDIIFNKKDEKIFKPILNIIRSLNMDIDNVIKTNLVLKLEEKFHYEKENIDEILDLLDTIQIILKNFEKLKIIRHTNIDEYINQTIISNKDKFSKYLLFIENLESEKFSLFNNDSLGNEIIAEVCFLFLNKIYMREIGKLQSIISDYEKEILKNVLYEEIATKLKELRELFEKYFKESPFDLTKLIEDNLRKNNNLTLNQIKDILLKLFPQNIELKKNKKLTLDEKLYYFQITEKK